MKPGTVAKSLAIGDPADGYYYALKDVRATGGSITAVPEEDIEQGIRLLARTEGVFTETAGGVTIAGLERMVRSGAIPPDAETVAVVTGVGLKTLEAVGEVPTHRLPARAEDVIPELGRS